MDKLISLINYVLSSAEKVVKHVSITNFEAEFAVKLFRSDKETLLSELDGFSVEEILVTPSQRSNKNQNNIHFQNHSLKSQNMNLKKQLMLLEAECNRLKQQKSSINTQLKSIKHNSFIGEDKKGSKKKDQQISNLIREIQDMDQNKKQDKVKQHQLKHHLFLKDREVQKISGLLKQMMQANEIDQLVQSLDKATKFNMIIFNNPENEKKKLELEGIIANLDKEYQATVKDIVAEFNEREEVIKLLIEKVPDVLDREIEGVNLEEIRLVELLELLLSVVQQKEKFNQSQNSRDKQRQKDLQQALTSLNQDLIVLSQQNQELTQQLTKLRQSNKDLSLALPKVTKQKQSFKQKFEHLTVRLRQLCVIAELSVTEIGRMQGEELVDELKNVLVKRRKEKGRELEDAMVKNRELEEQVDKLQLENARQQEGSLQQMRELKIHIDTLEEQNKQLEKYKINTFEMKKTIKEYDFQTTKINTKIKTLEQDVRDRDILAETNKKLNIDILKLQNVKDEYERLIESYGKMEEELEMNEIEVTRLREENKESQKKLEVECNQSKKLGEYTFQLSEGLKGKSREIEEKERIVRLREQEIKTLKEDIDRLTDTNMEKEENMNQKYQSELKEKDDIISDLEMGIAEFKIRVNKVSLLEVTMNEFEDKIRELENQISVDKLELQEKESIIAELKVADSENQKGLKRMGELQSSLSKAQQNITSIKNDNQKLRQLNVGLEQDNIILTKQVSRVVDMNENTKQQSIEYQKQIEELERTIVKARQERESQKTDQTSFKEMYENVNSQKQKLTEQLKEKTESFKEKESEYNAEIEEKSIAIEQLNKSAQRLVQQRQQNLESIKALDEKIEELNQLVQQSDSNINVTSLQIESLKVKVRQYQQTVKNKQQIVELLENEKNEVVFKSSQQNLIHKQELQQSASILVAVNHKLEALKQEYESYKIKIQSEQQTQLIEQQATYEIDELKQIITNKQQQIQQLQTKTQHLFVTNTTLLSQNQNLHEQNQEINRKIEELEGQNDKLEQQWGKKYTILNREMEEMSRKVMEKEGQIQGYIIKVEGLDQVVSNLEKQIEQYRNNIQVQQIKIQKQKLTSQLLQQTNFNTTLTADIQNLSLLNTNLKLQNQALSTKLQTFDQHNRLHQTQYHQTISQLNKLKDQISDLKEENQQIKEQRQQQAKMVMELNEKLSNQEEQKNKIKILESEVARLNNLLSEGSTRYEQLQMSNLAKEKQFEAEFALKRQQLSTEKQALQTGNSQLSTELSELKHNLLSLQLTHSQLSHNFKQRQIQLGIKQEQLESLRNQLQSLHLYRYQLQSLKKNQSDLENQLKIIQMTQQHRMNLVKIIVKKITNIDDIEVYDIDELLGKAIKVIIDWKSKQPRLDSATPKKHQPISEDEIGKNEMISLSGFCDDGESSGIGGSIIDKLGGEGVPSLNLQQIGENDSSEKKEVSQPITSIQNRLEYFGTGSLAGFVKTQESVNQNDGEEVNEERSESQKNQRQNQEGSDDTNNVDYKSYNIVIDEADQNNQLTEELDAEQVHVEQNDQKKEQVTKSIDMGQVEPVEKVAQQIVPQVIKNTSPKQDNQSNKEQEFNDFSDFKDAVDTSQLDSSNIIQQSHQPELLSQLISQPTNVLIDIHHKEQVVQQPQVPQTQQKLVGDLNDFSDFKDATDNSQLDHSNIELGEGDISNTVQKQQLQVFSNDFSDFKDITNNSQLDHSNIQPSNENILIQTPLNTKVQEHLEAEEFPDAVETSDLNKSILSQQNNNEKKSEQEFGESQFLQFENEQEPEIDQSLIETNEQKVQEKQKQKTKMLEQQIFAEQFLDYKEPSMSDSMISEKNVLERQQNIQIIEKTQNQPEIKEHNKEKKEQVKQLQQQQASLGDFGDFEPSQDLSKSLIQQQNLVIQPEPSSNPLQQHGFNDFGSVHESMSQSLIGQNKVEDGNDFEDFGNQLSDALNSSIMSEKMEEHKSQEQHSGDDDFTKYLEETDMRSSAIIKKE